ncbi:MAG: transcriptional regulator [Burkholderiales bacterium]|nr:transcriptional regulator [Burkholderiales bacterium]
MDIKPIRTEADHRAALKEIETLMTAELGTPERDKLDILATLVQAYEQKHFPLDLPDPVAAIKFRMEQSGLTIKDLEPMMGRANRIYEILDHVPPLTLPMIRRRHSSLGIGERHLNF